jgi:hypothetical protein
MPIANGDFNTYLKTAMTILSEEVARIDLNTLRGLWKSACDRDPMFPSNVRERNRGCQCPPEDEPNRWDICNHCQILSALRQTFERALESREEEQNQ